MENSDIYFALGKLTAEMQAQRGELHAVRVDVKKLVEGDTLARGGKKMLIKVGTLCSALGGGLVASVEFVVKHFS